MSTNDQDYRLGMAGGYEFICHNNVTHHDICPCHKQLEAENAEFGLRHDALIKRSILLERVAKAAKEFDLEVHCYSTGVSVLLEPRMRPKHVELMEALADLEKGTV